MRNFTHGNIVRYEIMKEGVEIEDKTAAPSPTNQDRIEMNENDPLRRLLHRGSLHEITTSSVT